MIFDIRRNKLIFDEAYVQNDRKDRLSHFQTLQLIQKGKNMSEPSEFAFLHEKE